MNIFKSSIRLICCLAIFLLLLGQASHAIDPNTLPTGYQSVAGNVGFSQLGNNVLNITTGANSSIANFDTFSVGSNATVNINQPGNNAFLLGKVLGGSLSQIDGTIAGTGNFFLLNPAGVLLSRTASVNLNSFLASTLNITNQDFLNGNYVLRALNGLPTGAIVNDGLINVSTSLVFLGGAIKNTGTINAGQVHLAVGEPFDILNGIVYSFEGKPFDAGLSYLSAVPVWGYAANAGKGVKYGSDFMQGAGRFGDDAIDLTNKFNHIFGNPIHKLDNLVSKFDGNQLNAFNAIKDSLQKEANFNKISGTFEKTVIIRGEPITVRGKVVDGLVRIGTAFKK
jgi:filamentous hemagglutinin family protein